MVNGNLISEDISKLKLAFNRGFTGGYLTETHNKLVMGREAPGNQWTLHWTRYKTSMKKRIPYVVKLENKFKIEKEMELLFYLQKINKSKLKTF